MPLQLGCYSHADQTVEHAVKSMEGANFGIMTPEVGDIILVCSDGVTDNLGENLLVRSLEAHLGSSAPALAASITSSPGNVIERALEQLPYDIAGQCHRTASGERGTQPAAEAWSPRPPPPPPPSSAPPP